MALQRWGTAAGAAAACVLLLTACGEKKTELGQGGSVVSGSAGPQGAQNAARELVRCDAPVATVALAENPHGYTMSASYQLPASPVPLVKLLAQQSGCFRVVDRGAGLRGTVREQELKEAGVLRQQGSTVAKGRGYEAQYTLTPSLTFSEQEAGRGLGGLIAMIPVLRDIGGLIGLVEQVKFKEAQTALLLSDNETTEQVAAATLLAAHQGVWLRSRAEDARPLPPALAQMHAELAKDFAPVVEDRALEAELRLCLSRIAQQHWRLHA